MTSLHIPARTCSRPWARPPTSSCASHWSRACPAPRSGSATRAASPSSSTRSRATGTWSATTSQCAACPCMADPCCRASPPPALRTESATRAAFAGKHSMQQGNPNLVGFPLYRLVIVGSHGKLNCFCVRGLAGRQRVLAHVTQLASEVPYPTLTLPNPSQWCLWRWKALL